MSSRAARSSSTLQAARSAVAERARRYAGPKGKQAMAKAGKAGKSGKSGGQRTSGQGKRPQPAKKGDHAATPGKGPRSTTVVLHRIDPVSVLRVSVLFYLSLCLALFTTSVLLWIGANAIGLVSNVESFMDEIGFTDFRLRTGQLLLASALGSVVLVVAGSLANYLMAVLYNLIGDVIGGIRVVLTENHEPAKK